MASNGRKSSKTITVNQKMVNKTIKKRIEYLEDKATYRKGPTPGLVYISGLPDSKTFEEAKAEYKKRHGFDLPQDAPVINIVADDGRRLEPQEIKSTE